MAHGPRMRPAGPPPGLDLAQPVDVGRSRGAHVATWTAHLGGGRGGGREEPGPRGAAGSDRASPNRRQAPEMPTSAFRRGRRQHRSRATRRGRPQVGGEPEGAPLLRRERGPPGTNPRAAARSDSARPKRRPAWEAPTNIKRIVGGVDTTQPVDVRRGWSAHVATGAARLGRGGVGYRQGPRRRLDRTAPARTTVRRGRRRPTPSSAHLRRRTHRAARRCGPNPGRRCRGVTWTARLGGDDGGHLRELRGPTEGAAGSHRARPSRPSGVETPTGAFRRASPGA